MLHVNRTAIIMIALAAALPACRRSREESEPRGVPSKPRGVPSERAGANRPVEAPTDMPAGAGVLTGGGIVIDCDQWNCGGNSAQIQDRVIGALDIRGARNENGFILEPKLTLGTSEYDFDIVNGEIVGKQAGVTVLRGKGLIDSQFVLHHDIPFDGREGPVEDLKVIIRNVAKVPLWTDRAWRGHEPRLEEYELAFAYELEFLDLAPPHNFPCREVEWGWEGADFPPGLAPFASQGLEGYRILSWTEKGHYAVLLKGETYDAQTAAVVTRGDPPAPFFYIACPGTALSKMKLLGYDPEQPAPFATTPEQRQAALRMITARYCGKRSHTVENTPLVYQNANQWFPPAFVGITSTEIGDVEAVWNKNGAVCLNTPRRPEEWTREAVIAECGHDIPLCASSAALNNIPSGNEWISLHRHDAGP